MSWREKLLPSSFKGAPFHVEDIDYKSGRRIASFEFPKLNKPATEDLGKKQGSWSVQAYVIGADYLDRLNELITACESDGAGILVHPFEGDINVQCEEIAVRQSFSKDGNMALVSMSFVEAGKELYPDAVEDKSAILSDSKAKAIDVSNKDFAKKFSVAGKGQFLVNSASSQMSKWTSKMTGSLSSAKGESNSIAGIGYSIRNMQANVGDTAKDPLKLAKSFSSNISGLKDSFSTDRTGKKESFGAYKKLFSTDNSASYNQQPLTQTRVQELENQKAIDQHAKNVATLEAVEIATTVEFDSYEEAAQLKEEILDQIDAVCENASDELYYELTKMKACFIDLVPSKDYSLPMLKKVRTLETENSLTLSYRIYGNLEKEQEIQKRNKIKNPLFIPSDTEMEVSIE